MVTSLLLGCEAEDLMRIRLSVSPLRNLVDALHDGPRADGGVARERWWASARRQIPHRALPVVELINAHPRFVPLPLVPFVAGASDDIDSELEALEAAEPDRIGREIQLYMDRAGLARPPSGLLRLRDGGTREVRGLVSAMRALYTACMADGWGGMRAALRRDTAAVSERAASLGLASAAGSVHPGISWQGGAGALLVPVPGLVADARVELGGRGLVLMPSLFGLDQCLPVLDASRPPTLVYPARSRGALPPRGGDGLAALIGRGRARALRAIGGGCTTGELATRLGVSAPTASQHTVALRNAELIASVREGQRVRHVLTDLGDALVCANPGAR